MKANELRIDNWVLSKDGRHIQMNRIMLGVVPLLEPIPLTPEVLEKCEGFEKLVGAYVISNACIFDSLSKINIYIKEYDTDYEFTCPEYLHQLQNLYFALTGEELQYKP